jgi:type I restriction enzyme M protein
MIEKDFIDAIIALPDQLFFNTGIPTYIWVFSNRKPDSRKNKIMLVDARDRKTMLRKKLGEKRYKISEEDLNEIVKEYSSNKENGNVKIFESSEFGYRAVTIQQPLRLKFIINDESLERLKLNRTFLNDVPSKKKGEKGKEENKAWQEMRAFIYKTLEILKGKTYMSRADFLKSLEAIFKEKDIKVPAKYIKIIWKEIGEHDDEAEICLDKNGNQEANNDLKDIERIPLKEDITKYFDREVLPYVPDAWIDESVVDEKDGKVGKIGYEIPFTRYFYKYVPPRDPEEIQGEIEALEKEIQKLMTEI